MFTRSPARTHTCTTARRKLWRTSSTTSTAAKTPNPNLDALVKPLNLTAREKQDLVAFIKALTGSVPKVTPSNCR